MSPEQATVRILLVDDEEEFRQSTGRTLTRRGFEVSEAASGHEALAEIERQRPEVVLLDIKMPGMDGIETLHRMREIEPDLPVIVLTGHGSFHDAFAGIKLEIVDFVQKPVDIERLAMRIRQLLDRGASPQPLRERTIGELMVAPDIYPELYVDQPAEYAFEVLTDLFFRPQAESVDGQGLRAALVFDRDERFVGILRFNDLLKLVLPRFLADSPYASFFTGMFIAQCKLVGRLSFVDLMSKPVTVDLHAPLMMAVHLLVRHRLNSLPVMDKGRLVGVLRDRAVILEIARSMTGLR